MFRREKHERQGWVEEVATRRYFRDDEDMSLVGILSSIGKCFDKRQMKVKLCLILELKDAG